MSDDRTRKLEVSSGNAPQFLDRFSVTLVVLRGGAEGAEYVLSKPRTVLGRGDTSDWTLSADAVSKQHAALEVGARGVRVVDLGSTNGTFVNQERVETRDLKHADQLQLGELVLQCLIEARTSEPRSFQIS